MAQAGFTPISLYYSTTAAAVPLAANLAAGELAINIVDGKLYFENNSGVVTLLASASGASGDVVGPASATDNALARFDATTGKLIQNSVGILSDAGILTGLTGLTSSGNVTFSSLTSGRVTFAGASGLLSDSANLTFDGTTLTANALTVSNAVTLSGGTANGVMYLNGGKVVSTGAALTFDGTKLAITSTPTAGAGLTIGNDASGSATVKASFSTGGSERGFVSMNGGTGEMRVASGYAGYGGFTTFYTEGSEQMRLTSSLLSVVPGATIQGLTVGRGAGAVSSNTAVGASAIATTATGTFSTGIGYQALNLLTSGAGNTAVGGNAMFSVSNGSSNSAFGTASLYSNVSGSYNTAIGSNALLVNTASDNTAVGYQSAYTNTVGTRLVAVGTYALFDNTTGASNVAVGMSALENSTTGNYLTAIGDQALFFNTTGSSNTAVGYLAGQANTTGSVNTAVGTQALNANQTGNYNTAFGDRALRLATGSNNTSLGAISSYSMTTGVNNTVVGTDALFSNTTASNNTVVGYQAGFLNTVSSYNTFVGYTAGYSFNGAATNTWNTIVGGEAGYLLTTGVYNSFLGTQAGQLMTTGSYNTIVGTFTGNSGGLDIRTSSRYIVLSDGDGNARGYYDPSTSVWNLGGGRTVIGTAFIADRSTGGNNTGLIFGAQTLLPGDGGGNVTNQLTNLGNSDYRYAVAHVVGVNFPATQVASANANTLDDYEEGTWTPTVTGGYTGVTYSIQNGNYTKIGRLVNLTAYIQFSGTSNVSQITVGSLPFAPLSGNSGTVGYWDITSDTNLSTWSTGAALIFYKIGTTLSATSVGNVSNQFIVLSITGFI
jgi:hypothetical protein